jgi:heme A synthase
MRDARPILGPAVLAGALLLIQLTLGILTVWLGKPADVASAHVAVGALTLVTTFALAVRAARLGAVATASCKAAGRAGDDFAFDNNNTSIPEREPVLAA